MTPQDRFHQDDAFNGRREPRKRFLSHLALMANCQTSSAEFSDRVHDLSANGVFLETTRSLSVGQEIAMTIALPNSRNAIKATGVVVRQTRRGFGVAFKIVFRY